MGRTPTRQREVAIKPHDLEKLERKLKKVDEEAVDKLLEIMRAKDTEPKIAAKCAEILLNKRESVSKTIDQSEIARLIITMKNTTHLTAVPEGAPTINFNDIHEDFRDEEEEITTIDMGNIKQIG